MNLPCIIIKWNCSKTELWICCMACYSVLNTFAWVHLLLHLQFNFAILWLAVFPIDCLICCLGKVLGVIVVRRWAAVSNHSLSWQRTLVKCGRSVGMCSSEMWLMNKKSWQESRHWSRPLWEWLDECPVCDVMVHTANSAMPMYFILQ